MLTTLKAFKADRLIRTHTGTGVGDKRFAVLVSLCFALHVGLLTVAFMAEDMLVKTPPEPQVIPVELVEEQPPEPLPEPVQEKPEEKPEEKPQELAQEKAAEPPPPQEQQEVEKVEPPPPTDLKLDPATDFARVAERQQEDVTSRGPSTAEREEPAPIAQAQPPQPVEQPKAEARPQPEPVKQEPVKPEPPMAQAPEKSPPPDPQPPEPEGLLAGAEAPPAQTTETAEAAPEAAQPAAEPENPIAKRFAFFEPVPKMEFDVGAKASRAPPGAGPDNYLTTLYGMIVPLIRIPPGAQQIARRSPAAIGFAVDGRGRLLTISVIKASGVPSIDLAVVAAIRQAAPYPPTPNGQPLGLAYHY